MLSELYSFQAALRYAAKDYTLGKADDYGQRINIVIDLTGLGDLSSNSSYLLSGWMVRDDGGITLNTPFAGFAR